MSASITGTPVEIDSSTNTGSQSVTVPAATGVFVGVSGFGGVADFFSGGSVTLGGVALTSYGGGDDSISFHQNGLFFLEGALASGAQTLAWDWSGASAPADGVILVVGFVTGGATSSAIRSSSGVQGGSSPYTTATLTALPGDLIIAWGEFFNGGGGTFSDSWTNASKFADYQAPSNGGFRNSSASLATALPSGNQTVTFANTQNQDGGVTAIVIKQSVSTSGARSPIFVSREAQRRSSRW